MEMTAESPRRRSSASSSPEFEFWMLRNPPSSVPQLPLLSADELFADGILLPLHILSISPTPRSQSSPPPISPPNPPQSEDPPPSKKWKDIFKPGEKKPSNKRDRKPSSAVAEINIHIWPFSRSRSSGNSRPRAAPASTARKASSAPCSRCNSHGESSKNSVGGSGVSPAAAVRKLTPSPARVGGIYLGRSNPVWQLRRRAAAGGKKDNGGVGVGRVLNLNVNTCIGHQRSASCRDCEKEAEAISDDRSAAAGGAAGAGDGDGGADGGVNGGLFNLKAIFTRKVY